MEKVKEKLYQFKFWYKHHATKTQRLIVIGAGLMVIGNIIYYIVV